MPKPLLFGDPGLTTEQLDKARETIARWDSSFVPGYSERKHENEARMKSGEKPQPLPRLHWIRVVGTGGEDVGTAEMIEYYMLGYKLATKEDLESMGFGMPPGATVDAQGRIRRLDTALAFVDEAQAEKNRRMQREKTATARGKSYKEDLPEERRAGKISVRELEELNEGELPWD